MEPQEAGKRELQFKQGFRWTGDDAELRRLILEAAFDYRGNVTLLLTGGAELTGYLCNRNLDAPEPFLEVMAADGSPRRRIPYGAVRGVVFSGKDPAEGRSWQTWLAKYHARKEAEARGEAVEAINLFPEPLE